MPPPGDEPTAARPPYKTEAEKHANTLVDQSNAELAVMVSAYQASHKALEASGPKAPPAVPTPSNGIPSLSPRAQGWLKHIWTKATTPDDWSITGKPAPWWDSLTGSPMTNYPRFDLQESSYSVGIMADVTPAWRECYSKILDEMTKRYVQHWGAVDWLNQFGPDPAVGLYPEFWKGRVVPAATFREYPSPGWTANGHRHTKYTETPTAVEPDPIAADAMLFYKGWLTQLMSLHAYVSGDETYSQPWQQANVGGATSTWTLASAAQRLHDQWRGKKCGLH